LTTSIRGLRPSARGEVEITSLLEMYLAEGTLEVTRMGRGFAWLDTGTHESLTEASQFVQILEQRQGLRVSCPEEIALRLGYITLDAFHELAIKASKSRYGLYLLGLYRAFAEEREGARLA